MPRNRSVGTARGSACRHGPAWRLQAQPVLSRYSSASSSDIDPSIPDFRKGRKPPFLILEGDTGNRSAALSRLARAISSPTMTP